MARAAASPVARIVNGTRLIYARDSASCCVARAGGGRETEAESKREAGKGWRGETRRRIPLAACWISFFPLEEIFTFSFVDYRGRLPFQEDRRRRSGGRRNAPPLRPSRVSVSTWLVRGRDATRRFSSCRLSNATQDPVSSCVVPFPTVSPSFYRQRQRRLAGRKSASIERLTR